MPKSAVHALSFVNANRGAKGRSSVRILGTRIDAVDEPARSGDIVIDLHGDRLLPGLINAHDHLQLNSLPRLTDERRYRHAREWIAHVDAQRSEDAAFIAALNVPREERLLHGGIKNLLAGVTTVAHHDPLYPGLSHAAYPVNVVERYGWSHSLYIDGEERVRDSYRRTPSNWPWIIHASEGLDHDATVEFDRLDALGCVGPNTVIVHGIALTAAQWQRFECAGASLAWCPSSNLHLFGATAAVARLAGHGHVALGTDSRLSGARDLLEESHIAAQASGLDGPTLESLATGEAADVLKLADRGRLEPDLRADLLVLPAGTSVDSVRRADVRLVVVGGLARYADPEYAQGLAACAPDWTPVRVDGRPKMLARQLATRLMQGSAREIGLEFGRVGWRAA